jgi:Uma2 family endonuclease
MARAAEQLWNIEDFLAFDDGTDTRYELLRGRIVAMAPPAEAHGEIVSRLVMAIGGNLQPPCRVIAEAGILLPDRADTYYQADLAITCAPRRPGQVWVVDPIVIVEVLSPSTAASDLERKLPDYRLIPSLREILVVSSTEPRVEHLSRGDDGWRIEDHRGGGHVRLRAFDIALDIGVLYRDVLPSHPTPDPGS